MGRTGTVLWNCQAGALETMAILAITCGLKDSVSQLGHKVPSKCRSLGRPQVLAYRMTGAEIGGASQEGRFLLSGLTEGLFARPLEIMNNSLRS